MRITASALAFLLCAAAVAHAEDLPKAQRYFQAGVDAYDEAKYEVALREFQHAHALSHNPELYFNMAACEEHMNHYQAASLLLRQYLIEKPSAEDRAKIEARIKVLDEREESIHRLPGDTGPPPEKNVTQPPGHGPVAAKPNFVPAFITLGITAAIGIAALGVGVWALTDFNSLESSCGKTQAGCAQSDKDRVHSAAIATDVLIGFTAAAAITTVALFAYAATHSKPATRARLSGGMIGVAF